MTHSYSGFSGSRSGAMPQQVPLSVYQQVVSDLETAHMRLAQMSGEHDHLKHQYQQLQTEIQQISQRLQALSPKMAWSPPPAPPAAPLEPQTPHNANDFDFLNHLKRRQSSAPLPSRSAPPPVPTSAPLSTTPDYGDTRPYVSRSRYPGRLDPREEEPELDRLDDLFTDSSPSRERPPTPAAYDTENSAYRRARDQHTGSQASALWIALAVVLVVGSFGAGFVLVQPFVSGDKTVSPAAPTSSTPSSPLPPTTK